MSCARRCARAAPQLLPACTTLSRRVPLSAIHKEVEMSVTSGPVCGVAALLATVLLGAAPTPPPGAFDPVVQLRAALPSGQSRVVVTARDAGSVASLTLLIQQLGGTLGRPLAIINACVALVPNAALNVLASNAVVRHVAFDRVIAGAMERTGPTTGATAVRAE